LNHLDRVIQPFDEAQLDLVARVAAGRDAIPVPFNQDGELLKRPEPLPLELLSPAGKELARPAFTTMGPQLPELLLEQGGRGQELVGPWQFLERATARQGEIGPKGKQPIALAFADHHILRGANLDSRSFESRPAPDQWR
jgi:hypothetical protein